MNYIKKRVSAFALAFSGIWQAFRSGPHLKIQFLGALSVIFAGFYFGITRMEWIVIILCCGIVLTLEMSNTAIEVLCDMVTLEWHPKIKYIKDVMAGAVLVSCIVAFTIGIILFYPYVANCLS